VVRMTTAGSLRSPRSNCSGGAVALNYRGSSNGGSTGWIHGDGGGLAVASDVVADEHARGLRGIGLSL
jgi:hypothetical protein